MLVSSLALLLLCALAKCQNINSSECPDLQCSHQCNKLSDIDVCTCPDDLVLGPDSKTCQVPLTVLLGMNRAITGVTEGVREARFVLPLGTTAFDVHFNKKEIVAYVDNTILRYPFAGELVRPQPPVAVVTPTSAVSSLAVDWLHQDVYWIGQQRSAVETALLSGGGHRQVVADSGETSPQFSNIVVDPFAKRLFWLGRNGVYSSDLEGKNLKSNLTSWPIASEDIALDTQKQLIYVIGNNVNGVNKVVAASRYDGTKVGELIDLGQPGSKVYGFGVLGNVLYWESNHEGENLYKGEIPSGGGKVGVTLVQEFYQVVHDLKIYHPDIQKPSK